MVVVVGATVVLVVVVGTDVVLVVVVVGNILHVTKLSVVTITPSASVIKYAYFVISNTLVP